MFLGLHFPSFHHSIFQNPFERKLCQPHGTPKTQVLYVSNCYHVWDPPPFPRLFPAGCLCKLSALQRTSYTAPHPPPPPAVNFLPVLHGSAYMLTEKLKPYRKYYIIPLALPVKSPSVWAAWGGAIYYKCHIPVVATFCFLWIILGDTNQGKKKKKRKKSTLLQPLLNFLFTLSSLIK